MDIGWWLTADNWWEFADGALLPGCVKVAWWKYCGSDSLEILDWAFIFRAEDWVSVEVVA